MFQITRSYRGFLLAPPAGAVTPKNMLSGASFQTISYAIRNAQTDEMTGSSCKASIMVKKNGLVVKDRRPNHDKRQLVLTVGIASTEWCFQCYFSFIIPHCLLCR